MEIPTRPFDVYVELSRIQRVTIIIPVEASNRSNAEAVGRAMAREAMDGRRRLDAETSEYFTWSLDRAVVTSAGEDVSS